MAPTKEAPLSFGIVLFPQAELFDFTGPLEVLNVLTRSGHDAISLSLIARNLNPISVGPIPPDTMSAACAGRQLYLPTHTFESAPSLDVLLVPGGPGALTPTPSGADADVDDVVAFVRKVFPDLKYLITVCTGAGLAARAGVLDGLSATTNKRRYNQVTKLGRKTHWIAKARWVVDGKVWTTAGVSAGIDGMVAWVADVFGDDVADKVCAGMEYDRVRDPLNEVFAQMYDIVDVPPQD